MDNKKKPARKVAAALKYKLGEDDAPKVVAAGYGPVAQRIEELARQENIPIHRDKVLAQALAELGIGAEIPPELYEAVAKILIQVARLDRNIHSRGSGH
ncbi:flagellar biosynthesis protein [Desulfohalotomaculum tongense]|uniref:EscU/YscU/HrcU family type III secretion system export apparatus switch protein n=1 Tax=Desulforadius tongensis TaxID=1216062 RepID=UPI00195C97A6|nr:EscU/YscU/HrcU family type III secretion system export apparatus switch protein [Desulforadius tongensis]MBM7853866.1 flagellar biosynthesis protein [Desulforadius tongensis]